MLNVDIIKVKSKELDVPFDNLLIGCCLEELLCFIAENYHDELWIINDRSLGLFSYKRGINDTLIAAYSGEEEAETFVRKMSLSVVSYFMNEGIKVTTDFIAETTVQFRLKHSGMEMPVMLIIQPKGDVNTFPREKSLTLTLDNNRTVQYMDYPLEERVSELAYDILDKLELIGEMRKYIDMYDILLTETVEGRKIKESLAAKCEGRSGFDMARFEKLRSYSDYTFMKKKWKRIKRASKRSELEWIEVHGLIVAFLEPIYEAVVSGEVFFGDWIPDIKRFLD